MGQEQGRAGEAVRALCVPYVKDTYGLSRLITANRNRCSTAVSWACHVVPKLCERVRFRYPLDWKSRAEKPRWGREYLKAVEDLICFPVNRPGCIRADLSGQRRGCGGCGGCRGGRCPEPGACGGGCLRQAGEPTRTAPSPARRRRGWWPSPGCRGGHRPAFGGSG